jgi:hypothetical protein
MKRVAVQTLVAVVLLAGCTAPLQTAASDDGATGPTARFESGADGGETVVQPAPVTVTVTVDVRYSAR